jgi:hypothetical protein
MKCIYYLSPSLKSTEEISNDLHSIGIDDWFLHIVSKDESGLSKKRLHSSNYLETLDLIRDGFIGAGLGFLAGLLMAWLASVYKPFGPEMPIIAYLAIIFVVTAHGAWVGGLTGIASRNRKLEKFGDAIERGEYIILIYAKKHEESNIKTMMENKHREARLAAIDPHFLNPFTDLELVSGN